MIAQFLGDTAPRSRIETVAIPFSWDTEIVTSLPLGENFAAFDNKFETTWTNRSVSP